jgi:hypothetical protein
VDLGKECEKVRKAMTEIDSGGDKLGQEQELITPSALLKWHFLFSAIT